MLSERADARVAETYGGLAAHACRDETFDPTVIRSTDIETNVTRLNAPADGLARPQRRPRDRQHHVSAYSNSALIDRDALTYVLGSEQACHCPVGGAAKDRFGRAGLERSAVSEH